MRCILGAPARQNDFRDSPNLALGYPCIDWSTMVDRLTTQLGSGLGDFCTPLPVLSAFRVPGSLGFLWFLPLGAAVTAHMLINQGRIAECMFERRCCTSMLAKPPEPIESNLNGE
jgi:hypothetical protein